MQALMKKAQPAMQAAPKAIRLMISVQLCADTLAQVPLVMVTDVDCTSVEPDTQDQVVEV